MSECFLETVFSQNQLTADRPDKRICYWLDMDKIYFSEEMKKMKYAKIGFTGLNNEKIIISFHKEKVPNSIRL